jgi:hypothetical protein
VLPLEAIASGDQAILQDPLADRDGPEHLRDDAEQRLEGPDSQGAFRGALLARAARLEDAIEERFEAAEEAGFQPADPVGAEMEFVGEMANGTAQPGGTEGVDDRGRDEREERAWRDGRDVA